MKRIGILVRHLRGPTIPPSLSKVAPVRLSSSYIVDTTKRLLDDALSSVEVMNASTEAKTKLVCSFYSSLIPSDRHIFLKTLAHDYNVKQTHVIKAAQTLISIYEDERGEGTLLQSEERLRGALTPKYQRLFSQISHTNGGVKFMVDLRADILTAMSPAGTEQDSPYLKTLNNSLRDLISLWFSVGFLNLERVTWFSPCDMLQKISDYEAVHPIRNWSDLQRRVGAYRRCFVFTHSSMPREPVVVLHTALTSEILPNIQEIVNNSNSVKDPMEIRGHKQESLEDPANITTAMFYSITSTQKGLQGVEMGNYLIKRVVRELQSEFPNMHQFSSLSPIPGFRDWLLGEINRALHLQEIGEGESPNLFTFDELAEIKSSLPQQIEKKSTLDAIKKYLTNNGWIQYTSLSKVLEVPLMRLCARYLYVEKRRGFALNPVANFHLRNGAVMWRINWLADCTPRGLSASCGMMVNYRYFLPDTENNSRAYMESKTIPASPSVLNILKTLPVICKETSPSSDSSG